MKKRLNRIWGIGLVAVMLITLLASAAPISAGTLGFSATTDIPDATNKMIIPADSGILDIAVATGGQRIYAATFNGTAAAFYKSSDGGDSWSKITLPTAITGSVALVAVAPDDEDIVVIAGNAGTDTDNLVVYASIDAGSNWNSLGTVQSYTGTPVEATQLNDLAISAMSGSERYVALAGKSDDGPGAYYFNLGATAPVWKNAAISGDFTTSHAYGGAGNTDEEFFAVAFSPNFPSDMVMIIVGDRQDTNNTPIRMHIASFNQKKWDADVFADYPVDIKATSSSSANLTITKADIAIDPEYLGGDDTTRIVFVGLTYVDSGVSTEIGDVFRMKNVSVKDLDIDVQIASVAWDGTNLAAGAYLTNNVYRSADALVTTPATDPSRGYKEIGVDGSSDNDTVIVRWSGSTLVGGKIGAAAGFGRSTDKGKTWNGITLIESALTNMRDVWVSPDGSIVYLLTDDSDEVSLWRKADGVWSRVFCFAEDTSPDYTNYIVRAADSDPDVVYIAKRNSSDMYYSTDGGIFKWTVRASRYTIQDLAVQDADIAYVGEYGSAKVSKTTNGGFTWATTKSTSLGAGDIHSMTLISANNLLVGSTEGCVSYTTDGNSSWNDLSDKALEQAEPVQVTASGLASGDYIFASTNTVADDADVERWQIGISTDWKDMKDTMSTAITSGNGSGDLGCFGIEYQDGVLYVLASDGTDSAIFRNANTETATPAEPHWAVKYELLDTFDNVPSALRLGSGSTVLWAIESTATELHTFTDSLVGVPPVLLSPAEGYQNQVNPVSGASMDIAFKWEKPISDTAGYEIKICSDAAGDIALTTHDVDTSESGTKTVLIGPNQKNTQNVQFAPGQTYYWTVRVSTPGIGPWAPLQSFSILPLAAQVPTILSPDVGTRDATTRPSFSWAPVAGATNYQFQLSLNPYMNAPIVDTNIASTAYRLLTELERGTTYYWRVQSTAPVTGEWSAVSNFFVAELPAEPTPPVVIEMLPAPQINIPAAPAPIMPADIIIPSPVVLPAPIAPVYIWAIIIIGAVLVIAVIVLIVRTRRAV